ncbi:Protein FAR1-RELATED SEQUENCE 5 [Linum grandiflorum]
MKETDVKELDFDNHIEAEPARQGVDYLLGQRPSEIMKLVVHEAGGNANVGFLDKDFYNFAYKRSTGQIISGDATNALTYLQSRKGEDKNFFLEFTENERKFLNLFWADRISKADYACFGELLLFDTTYKKNHYNPPS